MADPVANVVVSMPSQIFTRAAIFQSCENGNIYIGKPDTDPQLPQNQIQVYIQEEDGSLLAVGQPIKINAGGYPVDASGQIQKFVTEQNFSMTVTNATGGVEHTFSDLLKYSPDQLRKDLAGPNGVNLVGGTAKQSDIDALNDRVHSVEDSIYYSGKTAASHAKDISEGVVKFAKFFGDSTMFGSEPPSLNRTANYPSKMFQEAITNLYGTASRPNVKGDYAIPGTTLYDMIRGTDGSGKTYEQRLTESSCDFVFCNHGINDNQTGKDILQYRKDLISFVNISREHNATPILVTPNPQLTIGLGKPPNSKRFKFFVDVMREVAIDMAVDLVDNFYYMSRSLNLFRPIEMFPDGVHMSAAVYRQYGYNLAMPFVNSAELKAPGDKAGLRSSTWYSNSNNSRIEDRGASCGETFICEKENTMTGINFAVTLDRAFYNIAINQLYWPFAAPVNYFDNAVSLWINEARKTTGDTSSLDWDGLTRVGDKMYAGLHVIGVLLPTAASSGNGLTFSGVVAIGGNFNSMTGNLNEWYAEDFMLNGDAISMNVAYASGTEVALLDKSGAKVASVKLNTNTLRFSTFANGVEVTGKDLSTSVIDGTYYTVFRLTGKSLTVKVGTVSGIINTTVDISKLRLGYPATHFSVLRIFY